MDKLTIKELIIYPIKSLQGIQVKKADLEERGFKYDRRWMLVDHKKSFLTLRKHFEMAFLEVELKADGLTISHTKKRISPLSIPFENKNGAYTEVRIWDDWCLAHKVSLDANRWFTEALGLECELVVMTGKSERVADPQYTTNNEKVSFADSMPYLITGMESLNDLNSKASYQVPIHRFRPNIVFEGGEPYIEDSWKSISIGENRFTVVKPCGRCVVTTLDTETGTIGKEPLQTLSGYRKFNGSVQFGQYLTSSSRGQICVGETIKVNITK